MRLHEFKIAEKIIPALEVVRKNCSQILWLYKSKPGHFFYRGLKKNSAYILGKSPIGRPARNTEEHIHYAIIQGMMDLGLTAHRGNSIFVTPDEDDASSYSSDYSSSYIVFPFNGFSYTWSPQIEDFFIAMQNRVEIDPSETNAPMALQLKKLGYTNTGLDKALIDGQNEVMLHGQYIAINSMYKKSIMQFIENL